MSLRIERLGLFLGSLFFTLVIFFLLLEPILGPTMTQALESTGLDPFTRFIIRSIPFSFLFVLILKTFSFFRS